MWPDWTGQPAIVLAGGSSAAAIAPTIPHWCRIIAVNLAFRLRPDADVLYAADSGFWARPEYRDAWSFQGLKLAPRDQQVRRFCKSIQEVEIPVSRTGIRHERLIREPPGIIGMGGGNGAFQAFNIALQFGSNPIYLGGIDFCGAHWHPDHPPGLRNPSADQFRKWRRAFDLEAPVLAEWGIDVVNLSPVSALKGFRCEKASRVFADTRSTSLPASGV